MALSDKIRARGSRRYRVPPYRSGPIATKAVFDPSLRRARDVMADRVQGSESRS